MSLNVVILAAGKGTRMRSSLPKVLHPVANKPMVSPCDRYRSPDWCRTVAPGLWPRCRAAQGADRRGRCELGTAGPAAGNRPRGRPGHPFWNDEDDVLVLYGDTPLIQPETLQRLLAAKANDGMALLTVVLDNPTGYGRIVRSNGQVVGIVEQKDANAEQLAIREVNTGVLVANGGQLRSWLSRLDNKNAQGEFYLTDVIAMAHGDGCAIAAVHPDSAMEVEGANNRVQLAALERSYQQMQAEKLMIAGATLIDPARFDLRGSLEIGEEVVIDVNVIIEGKVVLGNHVRIGAGSVLKDCVIGDHSEVKPYSVIEGAQIADQCSVGPFTRLRPGAVLEQDAHVGNFVEMKKARLGVGSKCGHLTYLGDAEIGAKVNIGAGTITCNTTG